MNCINAYVFSRKSWRLRWEGRPDDIDESVFKLDVRIPGRWACFLLLAEDVPSFSPTFKGKIKFSSFF